MKMPLIGWAWLSNRVLASGVAHALLQFALVGLPNVDAQPTTS